MNLIQKELLKVDKFASFYKLVNFDQSFTIQYSLIQFHIGKEIMTKIESFNSGEIDWHIIESGFSLVMGYSVIGEMLRTNVFSNDDIYSNEDILAVEEYTNLIISIFRNQLLKFRFLSENLYLNFTEKNNKSKSKIKDEDKESAIINILFPQNFKKNPEKNFEIQKAKNCWNFLRALANYSVHFDNHALGEKKVKAIEKINKCLYFFKQNSLPIFEYHIENNESIFTLFYLDLLKLIQCISDYLKNNIEIFNFNEEEKIQIKNSLNRSKE